MTQQTDTITSQLSMLLADTYALYLKTQNFHWHVTGPHFQSLHALFETQYTTLAEAVDEIAERIRTLGHTAPGSFSAYLNLIRLSESAGGESPSEMLQILVQDYQTVIEHWRTLVGVAGESDDEGTIDLATGQIAAHEKTVWMLKSSQ